MLNRWMSICNWICSGISGCCVVEYTRYLTYKLTKCVKCTEWSEIGTTQRAKVMLGISMEQWNLFMQKWNVFHIGSGISDGVAAIQLFQCAEESLGDVLLKIDSGITSKPIDDVLKLMKSLAVIPVAVRSCAS